MKPYSLIIVLYHLIIKLYKSPRFAVFEHFIFLPRQIAPWDNCLGRY